jgi:hypothetical protein
VIAGRTRFYVVAAVFGASLGEALAGALLLGLSNLVGSALSRVPEGALLLVVFVTLAAGTVGGAWAGVAILRRSYRREADRKTALGREP